jgi:hypothetical protein
MDTFEFKKIDFKNFQPKPVEESSKHTKLLIEKFNKMMGPATPS